MKKYDNIEGSPSAPSPTSMSGDSFPLCYKQCNCDYPSVTHIEVGEYFVKEMFSFSLKYEKTKCILVLI